MLQQNVPKL